MVSGRTAGFKHSAETIEKMRHSHRGKIHSPETRTRISQTNSYRLGQLCNLRFIELVHTYPQYEAFFESRKEEFLNALQDIKSERELDYIRLHKENTDIGRAQNLSYSYSSSSIYAHEDLLIEFIDRCSYLQKLH